ncbi:MAG: hypothetical protein HY606_14435 [Planctomycetes bacterium]|nr:hypothetical protein [Planctomycetota bacterium]
MFKSLGLLLVPAVIIFGVIILKSFSHLDNKPVTESYKGAPSSNNPEISKGSDIASEETIKQLKDENTRLKEQVKELTALLEQIKQSGTSEKDIKDKMKRFINALLSRISALAGKQDKIELLLTYDWDSLINAYEKLAALGGDLTSKDATDKLKEIFQPLFPKLMQMRGAIEELGLTGESFAIFMAAAKSFTDPALDSQKISQIQNLVTEFLSVSNGFQDISESQRLLEVFDLTNNYIATLKSIGFSKEFSHMDTANSFGFMWAKNRMFESNIGTNDISEQLKKELKLTDQQLQQVNPFISNFADNIKNSTSTKREFLQQQLNLINQIKGSGTISTQQMQKLDSLRSVLKIFQFIL